MLGSRVVFVGTSGVGKSTLGEELAALRGVPLIELDALYWKPNWVESERDEFRARVELATQAEAWVVAGNYLRAVQDLTWPRATDVIWLDIGLPRTIGRILTRSFRRWQRRELLWGTNYESFFRQLKVWDPNASLIAYTFRTHRGTEDRIRAARNDPRFAHVVFHHCKSNAAARALF
jgi:adenylate kinase family enzyme